MPGSTRSPTNCLAPPANGADRSRMPGGPSRGSSTAYGRGSRGVTCRNASTPGRLCTAGTTGWPPTAPGTWPWNVYWPGPTLKVWWIDLCRWTRRSTAPISTPRTSHATQGDPLNYNNLLTEPPDHAVGPSRGWLSTKIHALVDGADMSLVMLISAGQRGDCPMLIPLLEHGCAPRRGGPAAGPVR